MYHPHVVQTRGRSFHFAPWSKIQKMSRSFFRVSAVGFQPFGRPGDSGTPSRKPIKLFARDSRLAESYRVLDCPALKYPLCI